MRIILEGNQQRQWTKRVICRECKAVLEIEETDLFVVNTAVAYAGETWEPEIRYKCPVCHSQNGIESIPSGIRYKLLDEAK